MWSHRWWEPVEGVMWSDRCVEALPFERWSDGWNCGENSGAARGEVMERNSEVSEIWRLLSLEMIGVGSPILPPKPSVGSPSSMQSSLDSLAWHSRPPHTRPSLVSHSQHHTAASLTYWQFSAMPCMFSLPYLFSFWALSLKHPSLFCTDSKHPIIQGCLWKPLCPYCQDKSKTFSSLECICFLYFLGLLSVLLFFFYSNRQWQLLRIIVFIVL